MWGWVVTSDIIKSKKIGERKKFQQQLRILLDEINERFSGALGCEFNITLGDQFSGLVREPEVLLEIILQLICGVNRKISFRFGIAYGEIETGGTSISGGPGYRKALKAVEEAKKKRLPLVFSGEDPGSARDVQELILSVFIHFINKFSCRQRQIMLRTLRGRTQSEIAGELDITQPAVSQALKNINWQLFRKVYRMYPRVFHQGLETKLSGEYTALIGSREGDSGKSLQSLLREINHEYREIIESRFVVTVPLTSGQGYEFQGLLCKRDGIFNLLSDLVAGSDRVKIGLGPGGIETELRREAVGMDGPAFYRAREAVEAANKGEGPVSICAEEVLSRLSALLSLALILPAGWTSRQWRTVKLKRKGWTQQKIANNLGVSRPAVAEHLAGAGWRMYLYCRERAAKLLE